MYCCGSDFTLLNIDDPEVLRYTFTNRTACAVPFGVSIILMGSNGLKGLLSSSMFSDSALQISLEVFHTESTPLNFLKFFCSYATMLKSPSLIIDVLAIA